MQAIDRGKFQLNNAKSIFQQLHFKNSPVRIYAKRTNILLKLKLKMMNMTKKLKYKKNKLITAKVSTV
jgi:hypothetical protein